MILVTEILHSPTIMKHPLTVYIQDRSPETPWFDDPLQELTPVEPDATL